MPSDMTQELIGSSTCANLEQVGALPWSQPTDILDHALSVRMGDGSIHIHSNLVDTVDEFTVKSREQIFLHHMFLRKMIGFVNMCGM